ncbi:MAG: hypothetical protein HYU98_01590, partial [Deltaproteobacteria bacterium]|nr:hypothetical protein [Deltaproteobacteria bacterium]
DVAQMVDQLFEQQKAAGGAKPAMKKAGELEEMAEVSKIIPDERTNAIIVLASRRAIDKVKSIIQKLDRKMAEGQEGKIHVYYLKHAKAKEMAETLSTLTAGAGASKKDAKSGGAAGPVLAEFEGGMKITADEATNSLVITATAKDYQTLIDKVVAKLDIPRSQVYLEAVVMELTVKKNKSYGLLGAFGGGTVGGARIFGSDPYSNTLSGLLTGGGPSALPGLLGGLIGRDNVPVNIGGEERSIPSMGIFLSALSTYGDSNIISTPNILTLDNQEAKIEVKKKSYYQGNPSMSGTILQYSTQSAEAGLILKITPQIGEAEDVRLKIDQTLSGFLSEPTPADKVPPPSRERIISTSVVTKDGQTVVLGGLMEDNTSTDKTKVPLLGDIPILGNLFKSTVQKSDKVNLLIFITPHIIKDTSDFSTVLKRKIEERNKFIEDNYGRKQRTAIRESIRRHREDLLEFKGTIEGEPAAAPAPASTIRQPVITAPPASQTELGETTKVQQPPKPLAIVAEPPAPSPAAASPSPPGRVKAPVITVPPPAPGARGDELDLAY